ncbi:MAG: hypothetical protein JWN75_480 [Candidatus Saccharibacteria bacterium]|nr:hypothetical protein [Candidatus Saccharibacteria bacterium]
MDNSRIKSIIASKKDCYFISPHFDDMAYSASMLAKELSKTNKVIVVNIFTEAGERPYTRAAKAWMHRCGYDDATHFFIDRKAEDKSALFGIANQVIDLGFADAPWRKKPGKLVNMLAKVLPEFGNIRWSFTYRYYARKGDAPKADPYNFALIKEKLNEVINNDNAVIFCPIGVGSHFDHLLTRYAVDALSENPVYWEDYPYILKHKPTGIQGMQSFEHDGDPNAKKEIIAAYKSQYDAMFGSAGPQIISEKFYYKDHTS